MNKKLLAGIIGGVAVVVAVIIVILSLTGTIKLNTKNADKKVNSDVSSTVVSQSSEDNSSNTQDNASEGDSSKTGDGTSNDANTTDSNSNVENSGENKGDSNTSKVSGNSSTVNKKVVVSDIPVSKKESKVTVPIYIENNPGIVAAMPVLTFDTNAFEYADCIDGDIIKGFSGNYSNGKIKCVAALDDVSKNTTDTGVLVNVVLTMKKGIKSGTYTITLDKDSQYANANEKLVNPTISVGKIVVK